MLRNSKRPELAVLAIFLIVSLGAWAVWMHRWNAQAARRDEMNSLYAIASGGDRASVRRLAEDSSPEAMQFIEKLAKDRKAFPEGRLEAIDVLGARQSVDLKMLVPLLWIDEPFVVRRAVAKVFKERGCSEDCISETLAALHAIWARQPTLEVQATALIPSSTPHDQENLVYLRKQTEEDYSVLLNGNPCLTRKTLQTKYGSDSEFFDKIRMKVGPCTSFQSSPG
jgi:hypothetical protein